MLQQHDNTETNAACGATSRGGDNVKVKIIIVIISWEIQADDLVEQTKLVQRSNLYE